MTEIQQLLVGMNELKQELARTQQAGAKQQARHQPQPFEGEDDKWRECARVFRSWSERFFFCGALAEVYEHVEEPLNEPATIDDLPLTALRFET